MVSNPVSNKKSGHGEGNDDDVDGRNRHHGRRNGNHHRRNGSHRHHNHNRNHDNGSKSGKASGEQSYQAYSSNVR